MELARSVEVESDERDELRPVTQHLGRDRRRRVAVVLAIPDLDADQPRGPGVAEPAPDVPSLRMSEHGDSADRFAPREQIARVQARGEERHVSPYGDVDVVRRVAVLDAREQERAVAARAGTRRAVFGPSSGVEAAV